MTRYTTRYTTLAARALLVGLLASPRVAEGQSLASRVDAVADGAVTFRFASRPEACGDGEGTVRIGDSYWGRWRSDREGACLRGPVQVRIARSGGESARLDWSIGPARATAGARDLGLVSTREATDYLLALAARAPSGVAEDAITPAVLADSSAVWHDLIAVARDRTTRRRDVREQATFWLGRFAQAALLGRPNDLSAHARAEDDASDLKRHAVFVLSQLPRERSVPGLLDVVRTNRDPVVRGQALFWLGQSGDERALGLFEQILK